SAEPARRRRVSIDRPGEPMTEILTESFCERCGTRYTFEAVEAKRGPLGAIGTLGRSFRHFVNDPGSSLEEAFAVARSENEQRATTHALEAFHRTFNFCLNCRQYTCGDCWNAVEGRCLTCAPRADAAPPETRRDMTVRVTPLDLAQPVAPIRVDPMTAVDASTNGAPAASSAPAARAAGASQEQVDAEAAAVAAAQAAEEARAAAEALAAEQARVAEDARNAEETRVAEEARAAAEAQAQAEAEAAAAAQAAAEAEAVAAAQAAEEARAAADAQA